MYLISRRRETTPGLWFEITNHHMAMMIVYEAQCKKVSDRTGKLCQADILGQREVRGGSRWLSGAGHGAGRGPRHRVGKLWVK